MNEQVSALANFAEESRGELPADFFPYFDDLEANLAERRVPAVLGARGGSELRWYSRIGPTILSELYTLLCTSDPKYDEVRANGKALGIAGVGAVADSLVTVLGLSLAVTTAATAFIAVAVMKLVPECFCMIIDKGKAPDQK
jgi:hypothetical protein